MRVLDDQPVDGLRRKLGEFERRLRSLRQTIEVRGISRDSLAPAIADAEAASKKIKDDAIAAEARMHLQAEAEALIANGQVELWIRDGETEKLIRRAEGAEACAAWSLIVATRAICDAELATLKAIAARMDYEDGTTE